MTEAEHKQRHIELHQALDELVTDWLSHQPLHSGKRFSNTSIMELMQWSGEQTRSPTPLRSDAAAGSNAATPSSLPSASEQS